MSTKFIAYQTNSPVDFESPRPCGMNDILYMSAFYPRIRELMILKEQAYKAGYQTVIIYDEETVRSIFSSTPLQGVI